jgi:hypothetical protein
MVGFWPFGHIWLERPDLAKTAESGQNGQILVIWPESGTNGQIPVTFAGIRLTQILMKLS